MLRKIEDKSDRAFRAALDIISTLREAGHVALLNGGCVRDRLLGAKPKDYDVATDARPERVLELYPRARIVGAKFGVVLIKRFGTDVEVATFRTEGPYSDGRHPDSVSFGTADQDALRRDFTINGMYYDPLENRVIDFVGGQVDLKAGIIRTIGDPMARFAEDHLRLLRAIRFAARLNFHIEPNTLNAISMSAASLSSISPERIWMELEAILEHPSRAAAWALICRTGLHKYLARDWEPNDQEAELARVRLLNLPGHELDAAAVLAALLIDQDSETAREICENMRLSTRQTSTVEWLVASVPIAAQGAALELADLKTLMAGPAWLYLPDLLRATLVAGGHPLTRHAELVNRTNEIAAERIKPPPLVSGNDLLELGAVPGPVLGNVLRAVYRAQLNEAVTDRDAALELAKKLLAAS